MILFPMAFRLREGRVEHDQAVATSLDIGEDLEGLGVVTSRQDPFAATQLSMTVSDITHPILGNVRRAVGE